MIAETIMNTTDKNGETEDENNRHKTHQKNIEQQHPATNIPIYTDSERSGRLE